MDSISVRPYEGDGKYIFISYAHKDTSLVYPILQRLDAEGYHIWYDEGIDPGTEWDEEIAAHVEACNSLIAFVSQNYVDSDNCKDELNFARDLKKELLLVYLEPVELPIGMQMRLNRIQAIQKFNFVDNDNKFYEKLFRASMLKDSKDSQPSPKAITPITPIAPSSIPSINNLAKDSAPAKVQDKKQDKEPAKAQDNEALALAAALGERYILGNKIAQGGIATVYEATQIPLQKSVVVKTYPLERAGKVPFFNDAKVQDALMKLNHPNLNPIYEVHKGEISYIIERRILGYTLRQALVSQRPFWNYEVALDIFLHILSALEALHNANLICGDVSVDNIMLEFSSGPTPRLERPYLTDFTETTFSGFSLPCETMLCALDSSPEKAPNGYIDFRSDIYEAGIVLEKMIHKCLELSRTIQRPGKTIDIYQTNIFGVIKKATNLSPRDRYSSVAEMRRDIERVMAQII